MNKRQPNLLTPSKKKRKAYTFYRWSFFPQTWNCNPRGKPFSFATKCGCVLFQLQDSSHVRETSIQKQHFLLKFSTTICFAIYAVRSSHGNVAVLFAYRRVKNSDFIVSTKAIQLQSRIQKALSKRSVFSCSFPLVRHAMFNYDNKCGDVHPFTFSPISRWPYV